MWLIFKVSTMSTCQILMIFISITKASLEFVFLAMPGVRRTERLVLGRSSSWLPEKLPEFTLLMIFLLIRDFQAGKIKYSKILVIHPTLTRTYSGQLDMIGLSYQLRFRFFRLIAYTFLTFTCKLHII